ncbi:MULTISPECIES: antibiotic biosynthesis monooxygenase [unclassified Rhodococcus (in: high G+C Gram-positive bacteria)]|uniref:antibiotic biosynthesis monooxygenase family protein n=1 Tax=unclassified Rhodococcus (in: high G+C Gram-positive bacteria) TaxID=192944 RepID=UPI000BD4C8BD|nr:MULTISPECIES: antibiotic biosynthesis monooxygenase [unclassified Rhodococcus (in: high G+C Gram-positive bacteria)]MBP1161884.1 C-6 monooxygenase [Rhodococcus sp. PvR099]PTR34659.1 C-6 monooxygenase [Rhodococcus sp. OK611]SNX94188.1 C-6 monooxygenase [Rhodococcus sp. OK270]
MSTDTGFYSIIDYTVDGPRTRTELVDAFAEMQNRWVSFYPGYRSARFHVSTDGSRVYNIVHWASEADYRNFVETSDTEGRMSAIGAALKAIAGKAEPRMSGIPTYTVVREVGPRTREPEDAA